MSSLKKDSVFDESNAYLGLGIKTEIAFVDADPFIDEDGDFDYVQTTPAEGSGESEGQKQGHPDNNNSYTQEEEEDEILESDENDDDDDSEENDDEEEEEDEQDDEMLNEKSPRDKSIRKKTVSPKTVESIDYIKDEDGKFICQICNKKLVDKKGLNLHLRLHTGENLKRCNICNRGKKWHWK
jgi:hypothetical protein